MAISSSRPASFSRSYDAVALNALLNDPRIRPFMGGKDGPLDGSPLMERGFLYLSDKGGLFVHECDAGIWEGHWLFTERGCYGTALAMVEQCVLSVAHRCLWGRVGVQNRAAALFTRRLGFEHLGVRAAPFPAHIFAMGQKPFPSLATYWAA